MADERDDDNNSANASMGSRGDGAEEDEPEWADLPEHEKARLRKEERSFRYQLLKTRVKISE